MKNDLKDLLDQGLSSLRFSEESRRAVVRRTYGKEFPIMKKRISTALAVTLTLVLIAAVAVAAVTVTRSMQAEKVSLARTALQEKYGLTAKTLGLFQWTTEERDGVFVMTLKSDTIHPSLTGEYTVTVQDGKATASWSYDDVDAAVYESGALDASVWGEKQLEAALKDLDAASGYSIPLYQQETADAEPLATPAVQLKEGERLWMGEIWTQATPGADDLTFRQAFDIAVQAVSEEFGLDASVVANGELVREDENDENSDFSQNAQGQTRWAFSIYIRYEGVEYSFGVVLDGKTGEVLLTNVLTGGNG